MRFIQKTPIKGFRTYYNLVCMVVINTWAISNVPAQQEINWVDINLVDTLAYARFNTNHIHNYRYPPSCLFDADYNTCWVDKLEKDKENPSVFVRLPELDEIVINLFSGYGKSRELYYKNSRPRKIRFSVFAAVNPSGYVSERDVLYKAIEFPQKEIIYLADSFGVQSVPLNFSKKDLYDFRKRIHRCYDSGFEQPKGDTCLILQIEILEAWSGTKYDDICISEIFFNDRFVSSHAATFNSIKKVYLNPDENALLLDDNNNPGIVVYRDTLLVLQIIEISENKKWAILLSMPGEIQGRVETTYLLVDLLNNKMVNPQLEKSTGNYVSGSEMYFETGENGLIYLIYSAKDNEYHKIELR